MQGKRTRRTPLLQRRPAKTIRSPAPAFSLARVPAIRLVASPQEPGPGCYIRSCSRCAQCVVVICRHLYFCGDSPSFISCGASPDSFGRFAQDASPLFIFWACVVSSRRERMVSRRERMVSDRRCSFFSETRLPLDARREGARSTWRGLRRAAVGRRRGHQPLGI